MRRIIALAAAFLGVGAPSAAAADACVVPKKLGVAIVWDNSLSMDDNDPAGLRGTSAGIALDSMPDGSVASASSFAGLAKQVFPPTALTPTSRAALKFQIGISLATQSSTNYQAAFLEAKRQLAAMPAEVDRKAVIFLSDGEPNSGYTADQGMGAPIFAIGLGTASATELAGIASRSGGQSFDVHSAGEAQSVFARIVALLSCDAQQLTDQVQLDPGESRTFPFTISPSDREFRSLAAWSNGTVDVKLRRPDGSALTTGAELAGETFTSAATYAQARGIDPAAGGWTLEITAGKENIDQVNVSIDVWKRTTADPPDAPILVRPNGGESFAAGDVGFSWTAARGATSYELYVDGAPVKTTQETYAVAPLGAGVHEWYVLARNGYGGTPSARRTITATGIQAPSVPQGDLSPIDLATKFRPALLFDTEERWRPLEVDRFLREPGIRICHHTERRSHTPVTDRCVPSSGTALMSASGYTGALDHLDIPLRSGQFQTDNASCVRGRLLDCDLGPASAIYVNTTVRGSMTYLDYWWFLRNNAYPADNHQGDWEGATVKVFRDAVADLIYSVAFASHKGGAWEYLNLALQRGSGQHVNVYLGNGTHAAYPRPCTRSCNQTNDGEGDNVSWLPEADFDGRAAWGNNDDTTCARSSCVRPLDQPWVGWAGRWGSSVPSLNHPPNAPGQQDRFKQPWDTRTSTRTKFALDGAPAAQCGPAWFGPYVAAYACDQATVNTAFATATQTAPGTLALTGPGIESAGAPGLTQAMGEPLKPGQVLTASGSAAAAGTTLTVKVATSDGVRGVTVPALGLAGGGKATVAVGGAAANPVLRVTDGAGRQTTIRTKSAAPTITGLSASQSGRMVQVWVSAPAGTSAFVSVRGRRGTLATRTVRIGQRGAARVRLKVRRGVSASSVVVRPARGGVRGARASAAVR